MEESMSNPIAFKLMRDHDVSGVSGTGIVAEGFVFADGTVALRWRGDLASSAFYDSLEDVEKIHGHDGSTRIVPVMVDLPVGEINVPRVPYSLDIEKGDGAYVEIAFFMSEEEAIDDAQRFMDMGYCTHVRRGDEIVHCFDAEPHDEQVVL
jgi:hypothetical protein